MSDKIKPDPIYDVGGMQHVTLSVRREGPAVWHGPKGWSPEAEAMHVLGGGTGALPFTLVANWSFDVEALHLGCWVKK